VSTIFTDNFHYIIIYVTKESLPVLPKTTLSALELPQSTTSPQSRPNAVDAIFIHPHHTIPATRMDSKLTNYRR